MIESTVTATPGLVRASDGYLLGAIRYADVTPRRATIVVAGATGVQQRFYRRFAEFAASDGYDVITFDYRGIGASAPAQLRGFQMRYSDWATLDIAAVIDHYRENGPILLVGHSFGGASFGLVPNIDAVSAVYAFGAGAAWHGWMSPVEALRVLTLWHLVGPIATLIRGCLPGRVLGLGSDMPLGVYRDWKRWARHRRFFFDDPRMHVEVQAASNLRIPVCAANSTDDRWATPRSRDALMSGYTSAKLTTVDIEPTKRGLGVIGHVGYFRPGAVPLWNDALDWLDRYREKSTRSVE